MKHSCSLLALLACVVALSVSAQTDSISTKHLNEIIVTGSNQAIGRNLLPYTVSTLSAERLEASGNVQLLSAVSTVVPSLFVTQRNIFGFGVSNGGSGHIKMRGVGGDRASAVLMMVDGQPQFAGLYSHHVADFYSTQSVDRVEVLRGPASVLYGSNAMAGVINIITKNPHANGVRTTLTSQYGSYNTSLTSISNSFRHNKFSSLVTLAYDRTDGVTKDFDFRQADAYAKIAYDLSDHWTLKADYSLMRFKASDPIYPALKGQTGIYRQTVIRGETSLTATNIYNKTNGALRLYYSYGNHFIHDPSYFHSLDDRLGLLTYQNVDPWKDATATIGFDFDRYTGKIPVSGGKDVTQNPLAAINRKYITEYSPYVTLQHSFLDKFLLLNAGLRIAISDKFPTQWIPQAGFVINPSNVVFIKASLAKGFRNPSFRELYLYKFANPDLNPETMMNYELSVGSHKSQYFSCDLTAYFAQGKNMIQQTATLNENTGRFINKGIEFSAKSNPLQCLNVWASYSYLHTSLCNLVGAPRNQYSLGLQWQAFKNFCTDAQLKGVTALYVADDVAIQNFATFDLRLSYQVVTPLQLFVNFDNITDSRYEINKGYLMPGFTAIGGFKLTI